MVVIVKINPELIEERIQGKGGATRVNKFFSKLVRVQEERGPACGGCRATSVRVSSGLHGMNHDVVRSACGARFAVGIIPAGVAIRLR